MLQEKEAEGRRQVRAGQGGQVKHLMECSVVSSLWIRLIFK